MIEFPIDALASYHYFRSPEPLEEFLSTGTLRLIGDSGAYSAYSLGKPVTREEFADWALKYRDRFYWMASLDVIGSPTATLENFQYLRSRGLDMVPTLHAGTNLKWMDYYVSQGVDFIGLGGGAGDTAAWSWLVNAFVHAKKYHPGVRFHGWGITRYSSLSSLPFFSVDSSGTISSAYRFGSTRVWSPPKSMMVNIKLDGRDIHRHTDLMRTHYPDIPVSSVARSSADNREQIVRWMIASTQLYAGWLQTRHQVSSPTWGINPTYELVTGPRVHMAESSMKSMRFMTQAGEKR